MKDIIENEKDIKNYAFLLKTCIKKGIIHAYAYKTNIEDFKKENDLLNKLIDETQVYAEKYKQKIYYDNYDIRVVYDTYIILKNEMVDFDDDDDNEENSFILLRDVRRHLNQLYQLNDRWRYGDTKTFYILNKMVEDKIIITKQRMFHGNKSKAIISMNI